MHPLEALFLKAKDVLIEARDVLVITHEKPDGDAISSLLAVKQLIGYFSKASVRVVCCDGAPRAFQYLPHVQNVERDFLGGDVDVIIIVDCGDLRRTGFADRIMAMHLKGVPIINIDHHPKNDIHRIATINIADIDAASTTQIVHAMSRALSMQITPELATLIFTGLYTDTGSFQHSVTTPAVLEIAAEMLGRGARVKQVRAHLSHVKPIGMLKLWGLAMERMRLTNRGVVVSAITQKDLKKVGATEEDAAGIVTMLEAVHQCRIAVLLLELGDGTIRGSLRSNNSKINAAHLAHIFGGGGHARAAGFVVSGSIQMDSQGWSIV